MKQTPKHSIVLALVALLAIASGPAAAQEEEAYEGMGFLESYDMLVPDTEDKDTKWIYKNPDYTGEEFHALRVEPLVFFLHTSEAGVELDPEEVIKMAELVERFNDTFVAALEGAGVKLVDEIADGVLDCHIAITNLGRSKTTLRVLPQSRALGVGRGGAAMEGECIDGGNGEVVAQVVKISKGARKSGVTGWAGADSAIRSWANRMASRFPNATNKE